MRAITKTVAAALIGVILLYSQFSIAQQTCENYVVACFQGGNCAGSSADPNLVKYTVNAGPTGSEFTWQASYYISENLAASSPTIDVFMWIELSSSISIPPAVKLEWEQGIEQAWSNRYGLLSPSGDVYAVNVDVEFISGGPLAILCGNLKVIVQQGPGAFDLKFWYLTPLSPHSQGSLAAHEVGHLLGNFDEYPAGAVDPSDTTYWAAPNSVMGADIADIVAERHYGFVLDWANQTLAPQGSEFQLVPASAIGDAVLTLPLPIPAYLSLATVLSLIAGVVRRSSS